jgi:acyl carrier protein
VNVTEDEVYQQLTQIFHDVFMRDDLILRADLTARDVPGWDSFKQIEIIIAVEEAYHFKFRTREIDSLHNVGDLVRTVLAKLKVE